MEKANIKIKTSIVGGKISAERWKEVYNDSLRIAKDGKLAYIDYCDIGDYGAHCLVPTEDHLGTWIASGDMVRGYCTDIFEMKSDLKFYTKNAGTVRRNSALEYLYALRNGITNSTTREFSPVFDGATYGERPHIWLLAIACLIASEFPEAAVVFGDISQDSCIKACKLAEEVTGRKVSLPLQFDYTRLYDALVDEGKTGEKLINHFLKTYAGYKDEGFRSFIKDKFTEDSLAEHFRNWIADETPFSLTKKWLEYGMSLEGLFSLWKSIKKKEFSTDALIESLFVGKVHIKDKSCLDITETDNGNVGADNPCIYELKTEMIKSDLKRKAINVYIPVDELRVCIINNFGYELPALDMGIAGYGQCYEKDKELERLCTKVDATLQTIKQKQEYEITGVIHLYYWIPGKTTIHPGTVDWIIDILNQLEKHWENSLQDEFMNCDRCSVLMVLLNSFPPLNIETVQMLFNNINNDDKLKRYWSILKIQRNKEEVEHFCYAMLMNIKAFDYVYDHYLSITKSKQEE